jgi:hypothetical protein
MIVLITASLVGLQRMLGFSLFDSPTTTKESLCTIRRDLKQLILTPWISVVILKEIQRYPLEISQAF